MVESKSINSLPLPRGIQGSHLRFQADMQADIRIFNSWTVGNSKSSTLRRLVILTSSYFYPGIVPIGAR